MGKTNIDSTSVIEKSIVQTKFPVKIAKIGIKVLSPSKSAENLFLFKGQRFRLLTRDDVIEDIYSVPEFGIEIVNDLNEHNSYEVSLWIVLQSSNSPKSCFIGQNYVAAAKRLINEFFVVVNKNPFDEDSEIDDQIYCDEEQKVVAKSFEKTVETLYKRLEAAHAADDCLSQYDDEYTQHEYLKVKLKPYQVKTIKWMLSRELVAKHHTQGFIEIKKRSIGPQDGPTKFFYNSITTTLTTNPNEFKTIAIPTGGILAEEMGLGKTIEILDLILLNPRPLDGNQLVDPPNNDDRATARAKKENMKCVCAQTKTTDSVCCTKCEKFQHRKCVDQQNSLITPDFNYICPACWTNETRINAKTTFIISPQSIKRQWKTEIDNRVQSGKISIFVYAGSKACSWVSPQKLASYDIILTDYDTLRGEFFYCQHNSSDRVLRNSARKIIRKSPLLKLNFWRLCLDESQMVIDMKTKHAQMISELSAVHRWAVTGTPIETSLDDLCGLISFINYVPYNDTLLWRRFTNDSSYHEELVSILQPIMRRTCKSESIMNEMSVPKQVQEVHYVELSGLNRYHYNQERDKCQQAFNRLISSYDLNTPLTSLSPNHLEYIMEPVRTLRRNCSILHVLDEDGNSIVMRPDQMLQYLVTKNESDANAELNIIASKLKSFVALGLGKHSKSDQVRKQASEHCRSTLNWAKNYENEPTMIESLLQTQTIHNMTLVKKGLDSSKYNEEMTSFDTRFYNSQFDAINSFKLERQKEIEKFNDFEKCFKQNSFTWANAALTSSKAQILSNQIKSRSNTSYDNVGAIVGSIPNISKALRYWSENLLNQRKTFKRSFDQLDTISAEVKSKHGKDAQPSEFFSILLNESRNCHLNESLNDDSLNDSDEPPPKKSKRQCTICSINEQIGSYGVFISDYAHKMTKKTGKGCENTNPSFQENILRVILQSNEYSNNINTKVGISLLTALENFRFEFQKYKSLVTSITKNVALYDRIKRRKPPKPTITVSSIPEWLSDIAKSKNIYDHKVRVNRYLNCMKENAEIQECAICMIPIDMYVVFECGHQCCDDCFKQLVNNKQFECPFCRQTQFEYNTHHFTLDKGENLTDSSKKIEIIVRKIHELKNTDPNVKILIFSQWSDILHTLKSELLANEIPSRTIISSAKSLQTMVEEFKNPQSNITCLLMPYRLGSKGLNITEATHVFLVEPIINRGEELQTLGRVHRIGQTRETCVHRFITANTIEETIFKVMSTDAAGLMSSEKCTIKTLVDLFADVPEQ